jgi:hypothetical protein
VRHAAHGHHRRRGAVRHGPDDGAGHGGASPRRDAAGRALSTVADALARGWALWPRCWAWSSPWARWAGRRKRLAKRWRRRWWARFSASCFATAWSGPLAANMTKTADEHNEYLHVLRVLMLSFLKGSAPMIAIEMGRRAIPAHVRPSFDEMEKNCKGGGRSGGVSAAATRWRKGDPIFIMTADKDGNRSSSSRRRAATAATTAARGRWPMPTL